MKRAIEFQENVMYTHQVIIEYDSESELDEVCEIHGSSLYEIIKKINDIGVKVIDSSEEYSYESDGIEYYDDYWTKNEEKIYMN